MFGTEAMTVCEDGGTAGRDGERKGDGLKVYDELKVLCGDQLGKAVSIGVE